MLSLSLLITTVILVFSPGSESSCPKNEIVTDCVNPCNTCEQKGLCDPPPACQYGCDCRPGYFRDENGYCVPEQQCMAYPKQLECPKNAIFLSCAPFTIPTCENPYAEPDYDYECAPGCVCQEGFLLRKDGQCVAPDQCYSKAALDHGKKAKPEYSECPKNAVFLSCASFTIPTCENPYSEPDYEYECVPGCVCKQGFLLRKDGQCVAPDQCYLKEDHGKENPAPEVQPKCPKNAVFIKCGSPCPPTCEDMQPKPCEEKCTTACYCKPGYLKRKDGICVRIRDCHQPKKQKKIPRQCPENAIFIKCGSPCPPTCEDRMPICEEKCTKACYCKPGYLLKTSEAKCVKLEHCNTTRIPVDKVRCPVNEEPSDCVIPCNDCKDKGDCIFYGCNKGCDCKKGYFRNKDGKCILQSECPKITSRQLKCAIDEQYYECTPSCNNTCENIYNPDPKCRCGPPDCFCKEGLVKREDGKCVPPEQCEVTFPTECNDDEQYYECTPNCKNTCENFTAPAVKCNCGPPGCFCKEGLVKRADGKCVPPNQCHPDPKPKCAPDEQFYECGPTCKNTCENISNPNAKCQCGPPCCFCKEGLVKRKDGKCVPPEQCKVDPQPKCAPDEQFYECGPTCKNTCENISNSNAKCQCGPPCCFCKEGLVKRKDGKCVPPEQCKVDPQPKCAPDEQFYECGPTCKNTCENISNPNAKCQCGPPCCFCKEGLVKRRDGKCVLPEQCEVDPQPKCAPDEQFYKCGPTCKNTCENISNPDAKCQCGPPCCFCKEGLVKRKDGKCVSPEQCEVDPKPKCAHDEQFYECGPTCKNTCENISNPNAKCQCGPPCCFCKKGLVKRKDGKCIPPEQCEVSPQPECDEPQKFYNCTPSCKNTCKNFFNPAIKCGCGPPGCFCKGGLVKNDKGKCIPPNQCPVVKPVSCPENAEFSNCGPSHAPTCKVPYTAPFSGPCVKGCFCKSGFVQDPNGKCVRLKNCTEKCLQPGEEFRECGSTCPDTCENKGRHPPHSCPYYCNRGCFCKKGLFRTKSGDCVPLKDCDKVTTSQQYFVTTTSKPMARSKSADMFAEFVPDDCHGCPIRAECDAYCKTFGDFIGVCIGKGLLHCRCA